MENTYTTRYFMAAYCKLLVSCLGSSAFLRIAKTLKSKKYLSIFRTKLICKQPD